MRLLLGIIIGVFITVGGAYIYDSQSPATAVGETATVQRPMVNWDIVNTNWQRLTARARSEWNRVAG